MASIDELSDEILGLVKSVRAFKKNAYEVFNVDDLNDDENISNKKYPLAAIGFVGAYPVDRDGANRKASAPKSARFRFMVIIAVEYESFGKQTKARKQATDLLDELRSKMLGYTGITKRPWDWLYEGPVNDMDDDNAMYYAQSWEVVQIAQNVQAN
jgi:hypothetical protein